MKPGNSRHLFLMPLLWSLIIPLAFGAAAISSPNRTDLFICSNWLMWIVRENLNLPVKTPQSWSEKIKARTPHKEKASSDHSQKQHPKKETFNSRSNPYFPLPRPPDGLFSAHPFYCAFFWQDLIPGLQVQYGSSSPRLHLCRGQVPLPSCPVSVFHLPITQ